MKHLIKRHHPSLISQYHKGGEIVNRGKSNQILACAVGKLWAV